MTVDLTQKSDLFSLEKLFEHLSPFRSQVTDGLSVSVTPEQFKSLISSEGALRRAGVIVLPLSTSFTIPTGIGPVEVKELNG